MPNIFQCFKWKVIKSRTIAKSSYNYDNLKSLILFDDLITVFFNNDSMWTVKHEVVERIKIQGKFIF